jgi:beta-lactamase class D
MERFRSSRLIVYILLLCQCVCAFSAEESFLCLNGVTDEVVLELGPHINKRFSPCSTFKITLSLMGYDAEILKDEKAPIWAFQEGYDDFKESWRTAQTPQSWMKDSCVWYSKILASQLGLEKIQAYLATFEYGNQDMSGGVTSAWLNSSLKISLREQVDFIKKMIRGKLPISNRAIQMTKGLLFRDELPRGWTIFGKTGWSDPDSENLEVWWFVGWIEKDHALFPFAYNMRDTKINPAQGIPRIKQLLAESNVMMEASP